MVQCQSTTLAKNMAMSLILKEYHKQTLMIFFMSDNESQPKQLMLDYHGVLFVIY